MMFYPGYRSKHNYPKTERKSVIDCPICKHGMLNDAKTGKLRDCLVCNGSGLVKKNKKW